MGSHAVRLRVGRWGSWKEHAGPAGEGSQEAGPQPWTRPPPLLPPPQGLPSQGPTIAHSAPENVIKSCFYESCAEEGLEDDGEGMAAEAGGRDSCGDGS